MDGSDDEDGVAFASMLDPVEDDGYVSPDFDLPPASDDDEDEVVNVNEEIDDTLDQLAE